MSNLRRVLTRYCRAVIWLLASLLASISAILQRQRHPVSQYEEDDDDGNYENLEYHPNESKWRFRTTRALAADPSLPSTPLPPAFPKVLEGPLVWEGADFKGDTDWTHILSKQQLHEIHLAVTHFEGLNLPLSQLSKNNFRLPTLGPVLEGLSRDLHTGRGFFVVRGVPVDTYTRFQNIAIYTGITKYVAPTFGVQDPSTGAVLGHIADLTTTHEKGVLGAPSYTREAQPFHSDPGDVVSLFCLGVAGAGGGESKLASGWRVYNELARTRPDLVKVLSEPFPLEIFNGIPPNHYRMRPILFYHDKKLVIKNARRLCTGYSGLERSKDVPRLSQAQMEAMDALHFLAERYHVTLAIQKGDIQYVNDLALFHARSPFVDTPGEKRHLVRFWLRNDELAWETPPSLKKRWGNLYESVPPEKHLFPLDPEIRSPSRGRPIEHSKVPCAITCASA